MWGAGGFLGWFLWMMGWAPGLAAAAEGQGSVFIYGLAIIRLHIQPSS